MKIFQNSIFIFLLTTSLTLALNKTELTPKTLALVNIIREGTSTPKTLEFDFSTLKNYQPETLLINGERMIYRLGQEIRGAYKEFFYQEENIKNAKFYSESTKSSIQSSQVLSLGLQNQSKFVDNITNEKSTYPPFEGLRYIFKGNSVLPFNTKIYPIFTQNIEGKFSEKNAFFEEEQRLQCPLFFKKIDSKSENVEEKTSENFYSLIKELGEIGIEPQGNNKKNGWNSQNLEILFKNSETKLFSEGVYNEEIDPELYNMLLAWYSYSLNIKYFEETTHLGAYLTDRILNTTLGNFKKISENREITLEKNEPEISKLTNFMTDGTQIYILLKMLGLSPKKCIEEIAEKGFSANENCLLYPSFGSSLSFELSEIKNEKYARILFNIQPIPLPCESTEIKNGYCVLKEFTKMVENNLLMKNFDKIQCYENPEEGQASPVKLITTYSNKARKNKILCLSIWIANFVIILIYLRVITKPRNEGLKKWEEKFPKGPIENQPAYSGLAMRSMSSIVELGQLRSGNSGIISPTEKKRINFGGFGDREGLGKIEEDIENERRGSFNMNVKQLPEEVNYSMPDSDENRDSQMTEEKEEDLRNPYEMSPPRNVVKTESGSSNEHLSPVNFKNRLYIEKKKQNSARLSNESLE